MYGKKKKGFYCNFLFGKCDLEKSPSFDLILKYIWSTFTLFYALWPGPPTVAVNWTLPAEPVLGCPVTNDRCGPRNNKSIYESETVEMRQRVCLRSSLPTLCSLLEYWKGIVMAVTQEMSPLSIRKTCLFVHVNMWGKASRKAALFHPVVSQTQASYRNLARLSLCSASSSSSWNLPFLAWAAVKQVIRITVMFYQLFIIWPSGRNVHCSVVNIVSSLCVCLCEKERPKSL